MAVVVKFGDRPLQLRRYWNGKAGALDLNLTDLASPNEGFAILQDAAAADFEGRPTLRYSRDRNAYSGPVCRFLGLKPSYDRVVRNVDRLIDAGFLTGRTMRPGPCQQRQSTLRLSDDFSPYALEILEAGKPAQRARMLEMRDENKTPRDASFPQEMVQDMDTVVRHIQGHQLSLKDQSSPVIKVCHGHNRRTGRDIYRIADTRAMGAYRVFSNGLDKGGRIYGPYYINLPKDMRRQLLINGEAGAEVDYSAMHPRLLYALQGSTLDRDPYDVEGYEREVVKITLNVMINSASVRQGTRALINPLERRPEGWPFWGPRANKKVSALMEKLKKHHQAIERSFNTGAGLKLQAIDSSIMMKIIKAAARQGLSALPLHDAAICQHADTQQILAIMDQTFREHMEGAILPADLAKVTLYG